MTCLFLSSSTLIHFVFVLHCFVLFFSNFSTTHDYIHNVKKKLYLLHGIGLINNTITFCMFPERIREWCIESSYSSMGETDSEGSVRILCIALPQGAMEETSWSLPLKPKEGKVICDRMMRYDSKCYPHIFLWRALAKKLKFW